MVTSATGSRGRSVPSRSMTGLSLRRRRGLQQGEAQRHFCCRQYVPAGGLGPALTKRFLIEPALIPRRSRSRLSTRFRADPSSRFAIPPILTWRRFRQRSSCCRKQTRISSTYCYLTSRTERWTPRHTSSEGGRKRSCVSHYSGSRRTTLARSRNLTRAEADKRSIDCAGLRPALLFDPLAAQLRR